MTDKLRELAERWTSARKAVTSYEEGCVDARNTCADELLATLNAEREQVGNMSLFTGVIGGVHVGLHGSRESIEALDAFLADHPPARVAQVDAALQLLSELGWEWVSEKWMHNTTEPVSEGEATTTTRLIEMCVEAWQEMNDYTNNFDKGSKAAPYAEVAAFDLVNWCQVISMASRGLHKRITNENLSSFQYNKLLAKYEQTLAAQPRAVPDGWVLVPVEPTMAMLENAQRSNEGRQLPRFSVLRTRWKAMLAAAPSPETKA